METIQSFAFLLLELTAPFLVISFVIHFIEGYIPYERMQQLLAEHHPFIGAIIAVLFAFVTPFCSCSTIPVVVSLLNKNVRFGLVMIFLFASPVLDPTILTIMIALLGVKVAAAYTGRLYFRF